MLYYIIELCLISWNQSVNLRLYEKTVCLRGKELFLPLDIHQCLFDNSITPFLFMLWTYVSREFYIYVVLVNLVVLTFYQARISNANTLNQ